MNIDSNSVDQRLRRVIPFVQPFGITNAPVRVGSGNNVVETPRRLWRMNIYSGTMNGNYIGSNTNERFFSAASDSFSFNELYISCSGLS